jgi:hypothetical protein
MNRGESSPGAAGIKAGKTADIADNADRDSDEISITAFIRDNREVRS